MTAYNRFDPSRIRIGISACLLGRQVRFDGGHKRSPFCTDVLSRYFEFVPLCPEVGSGLPTPRQPIRLVGDIRKPRAVGTRDPQLDVTEALQDYAHRQLPALTRLSGYILMQKSPSCGMERVKVYDDNGVPQPGGGQGLFAAELMRRYPLLPVEENGRLQDPLLRENFIARVYAYHEWQALNHAGLSVHHLLQFHARYKYRLMAHSQRAYKELGQMLAQAGKQALEPLAQRYIRTFMTALKQPITRRNHANVLMHMQGYLKRDLPAEDKQELGTLIDQYRRGIIPLVAPLTLLKHHLRRHPNAYMQEQIYLQPYPDTLSLHNNI